MSARKIVVTWPNATHQLLATSSLVVREGATQLSPASSFPGDASNPARFEFDVQSLSSKVGVNLTFTSSIGGGTAQVLNANQILAPKGADLTPESHQIDPNGPNKREVSGTHPLISTGSDPANGSLAVTVIQVNTQFVNVTDIWNKTAKGDFLTAYNSLHEPDVTLVVLGFTGGSPLVWMASIPKACVDSTDVSPMVFFRPTLPYKYTTLDDPNHAGSGMYALCRNMLAPDVRALKALPGLNGTKLTLDLFNELKGKLIFQLVCSAFEAALVRSGKRVVLLTPFPESGTDFGEAQTSLLCLGKVTKGPNIGTSLVDSAVRLLRAEDKILRADRTFRIKRRGLMGYSAGGSGFWKAFSANKKKIEEVYAFDPEETKGKAPEVAQWAAATPGFRLRLVGAFQFNENNNIKKTIAATKAAGEVSTHPPSQQFWLPTAPGGSAWWAHVMSTSPNFRKHNDLVAGGKEGDPKFIKSVKNMWHQFVIFGGEVFDSATDAPRLFQPGPNTQTFFEMFLRKSGF